MKNMGLILTGASLSTGIASGIFLAFNLLVWAILAAWAGSVIAFVAFALIAWALQPKPQQADAEDGPADAEVDIRLSEAA